MIKAKKHLGQHFLADKNIARKIAELMPLSENGVLEIGPGTGVLTRILREKHSETLQVVEIDRESIEVLKDEFPDMLDRIHFADFLKMDISSLFPGSFHVIGNFPYNISSPILFKVIEHHKNIPIVAGMFQKEVAERIASSPKSKQYGILSIWVQLFYDVKYCFTVNENVFIPPPKVKSGVIVLNHINRDLKGIDEKFILKVVKAGFNQRRKTLRNSLSSLVDKNLLLDDVFNKRPEQLSVEEFIDLSLYLKNMITNNDKLAD